jgi:hypothetical protein
LLLVLVIAAATSLSCMRSACTLLGVAQVHAGCLHVQNDEYMFCSFAIVINEHELKVVLTATLCWPGSLQSRRVMALMAEVSLHTCAVNLVAGA